MTTTQASLFDDVLDAAGDWKSLALQGIRALAASGIRFTAFDLVEVLGVPEPPSPACWGSVFHRAKADGLIVRVGYVQSRRPSVAGSAVAEWRGAP